MRKTLVDIQARIADLKDKKSKAESNKSNAKDDEERRKYEDEIKDGKSSHEKPLTEARARRDKCNQLDDLSY